MNSLQIEQAESPVSEFVESRVSERWADDPNLLNVAACAPFTLFPLRVGYVSFTSLRDPRVTAPDRYEIVNGRLYGTGRAKLQRVTNNLGAQHLLTWDICGNLTSAVTPETWAVTSIVTLEWWDYCEIHAAGAAAFEGIVLPSTAPNPAAPVYLRACAGCEVPCTHNRFTVFPVPVPDRANANCIVASAAHIGGSVFTGGNDNPGFTALRARVWLAGNWMIKTWQVWEPQTQVGHCVVTVMAQPVLLSTEFFSGTPLLLDTNGTAVYPQPANRLTAVDVVAAPYTVKHVYAII